MYKISLCCGSNFLANGFNLIAFWSVFDGRILGEKTLVFLKSNRKNLFVIKKVEGLFTGVLIDFTRKAKAD